MSDYLSQKFKVLSFINIIAVVFWHGYMMPTPAERFEGFYLFENILTSSLLRFSVPLFFAISGFLFFYKPFHYLEHIKKRIRTLLVPYLIWTTLGVLFVYTIQLIPSINRQMNQNWVLSPIEILKHLTISPIQYQFWFLRDLIGLALLSPIIYWMAKQIPYVIIPMLLAMWIWQGEYTPYLRPDSALFFCLGATIALHKMRMVETKSTTIATLLSGVLWLSGGIIMGITNTYPGLPLNFIGLYQFNILCGMVFIWCLYDQLNSRQIRPSFPQSNILQSGFFIYCMQEPLLTILEKVGMNALGHSNFQLTLLYFGNTTLVVIIGTISFLTLRQYTPRLLSYLTGGR
jgi:fucose 4-O-acetylase-like acetyltransferase